MDMNYFYDFIDKSNTELEIIRENLSKKDLSTIELLDINLSLRNIIKDDLVICENLNKIIKNGNKNTESIILMLISAISALSITSSILFAIPACMTITKSIKLNKERNNMMYKNIDIFTEKNQMILKKLHYTTLSINKKLSNIINIDIDKALKGNNELLTEEEINKYANQFILASLKIDCDDISYYLKPEINNKINDLISNSLNLKDEYSNDELLNMIKNKYQINEDRNNKVKR